MHACAVHVGICLLIIITKWITSTCYVHVKDLYHTVETLVVKNFKEFGELQTIYQIFLRIFSFHRIVYGFKFILCPLALTWLLSLNMAKHVGSCLWQ